MSEENTTNNTNSVETAPKPEMNYTKRYFNKNLKYKKKVCRFCSESELKESLSYKHYKLLWQFITNRGKIIPRRFTGTCTKHQRVLSKEIKRARIIGLLPFKVQ